MLPKTTRARLALYRERAAKNKHGYSDWRQHKYGNTYNYAWHSGTREDGLILTDDKDTLGDYLGDWKDLRPWLAREATGFYTDSFCHNVITGGVVRLRGARFTLYIPCTYESECDGATLYFKDAERVERNSSESDHDKAIQEACGSAYHYAEREAEKAREDDAQQMANDDIATAREEIHDINKAVRALLAEIRGREFTENVCAALRHRLLEYLADRKRAFKTIREREENYWSAVSY